MGVLIPTLSLGGRLHIEDDDFGRDRSGRADVDLAREISFKFLNFIEGFRMSSLKEIRELLVDYSYNGFISDEKFVLLYDEI